MKKSILCAVICCISSLTITAQASYTIKNKWKHTYLKIDNGRLHSAKLNRSLKGGQWQIINAGNKEYRIKNLSDGTYLNIETHRLRSTPIENGWWSAKWRIHPIENSNFVRISNVWKPDQYINTEEGLGCSKILTGWFSAMWEMEKVDSRTASSSVAQNSPNNNNAPVVEANPGNNNTSGRLFNKQLVLEAHNALRREVGVPPLKWSKQLAAQAQRWADKLALKNRGQSFFLKHSKTPGLGENVSGGHVNGDPPEKRVLLGWGENEKVNFNSATRKCHPGTKCGHYTQVIWRKTTAVGCGMTVNANGKYILVCNYSPPGNYRGQPAY